MIRTSRSILVVALFLLGALAATSTASAQTRLSDKDVEQQMKNLNDDTKKFRSAFNSALSKSTIRKTSEEKDAKTLAQNFQTQTEAMYQEFKKSKKSDPYLQNCLDSAQQIERVLNKTQLDSATTTQWTKVKGELDMLAHSFHLPKI